MNNDDFSEKKIELSVSIKNSAFDCKKLAETLRKCGIESNIIQNYSITRRDNSIYSELGCKVELHNIDPKDIKIKVWEPIKKEHNFECGHLWIQNEFNGCVYDYFNK